jgi:hypothetical protein
METPRRPLWLQILGAGVGALACVVAGLAAGATWTDALLFGIPGGLLLGLAIANMTWWDVLFSLRL